MSFNLLPLWLYVFCGEDELGSLFGSADQQLLQSVTATECALTQRFSSEASNRRICSLIANEKETGRKRESGRKSKTTASPGCEEGAPLASLRANPAAPRWWLWLPASVEMQKGLKEKQRGCFDPLILRDATLTFKSN